MFISTFKVNVKGQSFKMQWINDCFMVYGRLCVNIWAYAGIIESKYLTLIKMKLTNDIEHHLEKVKVISSKIDWKI